MQWNDWLGNLSYVLFAASYLVTSMLWLRVLAILGLGTEAIYFYATGSSSLWVAIGWSAVFLVINAVQLYRLLREMLSVRLSADERMLKAGPFAALGMLSFHRLMKAGRWQTLAPGTVLTRQHQPVMHLHALACGVAGVEVDGQPVAAIRAGGIVGEMSLLSDGLATATVTVTHRVRAFVIARADLERLLDEHEDLRAQFHQALGSELVAKLLALRGRSAPTAA